MTDRLLLDQWDSIFLVTISRFRPGLDGVDDVGSDDEAAVEIFHVGVWSCGLSDAQTSVALGWQNDGADLVGLECVAHTRPRGVDALVEERLFDGSQQMICKHAKKGVSPILRKPARAVPTPTVYRCRPAYAFPVCS